MKVTRVSQLTGKTHTMDLEVTQEQIDNYLSGSGYVQDIFRGLSPDEREFVKTGITKEEWDMMRLSEA